MARRAAQALKIDWARRPRSPTPTRCTTTSRRRASAGWRRRPRRRPRPRGDVDGGPRRAPPACSTRAIGFRTSRTCRSSRARPSPNGPTARSRSGPARSGRSASAPRSRRAFSLAEDRVRVIVPDMGSGYGGKHTGEQAVEAARLARAVKRPVKLVYRRDEEFSWGYFRPAGVIDITAASTPSGRLTAVGVRQLELRQFRPRDAVRHRQTGARRFTPPIRPCGRVPTAGSRRRPITTRARCTWTPSRARLAWTRWTSV